jgi:hypothetical protein
MPTRSLPRNRKSHVKKELLDQVFTLVTSVEKLSSMWPKSNDGQPMPLDDAAMPADVARQISESLHSISSSLSRAVDLVQQSGQPPLLSGSLPPADPTTRDAYAMVQSAAAFLHDLGWLERQDGIERPDPLKLPALMPQQTAPEVKAAAMGIADGPKLRRWEVIEGEIALRHAVKGSPIETKLVSNPLRWLAA